MQVSNFTEVRTVEGIKVEADENLFVYTGQGFNRAEYLPFYGINAGHPSALAQRAHDTDGVLPGIVKVTRLRNAAGEWFSLRSIGRKGNGRTVYLRGDATVALVGQPIQTVSEFYRANS